MDEAGSPEDCEDKAEVVGFGGNSIHQPSWENLPIPVFRRVFENSNSSFVQIARQVCTSWRDHAETEIGLNVKIDDTLPGNLDFVQSVIVNQARVVNLRELTIGNENFFAFPQCLSKLTLCGKMPNQWRVWHLKLFPNLSHFVIRGAALYSQDITGSPLPEIVVPSSTDLISLYESHEPLVETQPIWLKLKKVEVVLGEYSFPSPLSLSIRIRDPDRAIQHERDLHRLYFIVLNNASYILTNLRSPHLNVVQLYIYPKAGIAAPQKLNWRHTPLQRFLDNHRKSLKELYLPEFEGKYENSELDLKTFPTRLRKLQITLSKYIGDREESREQNTLYWKTFLMEQTQLVDVYLIFLEMTSSWVEECLTSLAYSSKDTLTYIDVVVQAEETVHLNLELFAFCHKLAVLKLSGRDTEVLILRNFCRLPASLEKVYMSMALIEMPDPQQLLKFSKLEMLELRTILAMDHRSPNRNLEMVRSIFALRKLSLLSLTFDAPINSNRELMTLLRSMDLHQFDAAHPTFTIQLFLAYEIHGWAEERFDEEYLKIEYINSREPEDYVTWQNRHRNAISVDDEDHRIFIFQTLPFLLDMGMRERQNAAIVDDDDDDDDDNAFLEDRDSDTSVISHSNLGDID